ncbi:maturase-like protein (mitochondrion) [Saccharomyces cerevisiae YJM1355]|nr:maturase-like protein [Saccharomyces cerevisiae YJM1355]
MIKWTMINIYLLLMFLIIKNNNNNNNYNNITKYNKDMDLYSIQSPYIKNMNIIKRGYHTSLNNKLIIVQKDNKKNNKNNLEMDNFYKWLVGFTDGDGSFYIKLNDKKYLRFFYGFRMHIDDKACLEKIRNMLNMPSNFEETTKTIMLVNSQKKWLYSNIVTIFDKYPCLTIKYYSYYKWKMAMINNLNGMSYNNKDLLNIKNTINNYEVISNLKIPYDKMNDYWILGFIEAEGSFDTSPKRNICGFNVSQHKRSINTLKAIKSYVLNNWKPIDNTPLLIKNKLLKDWDSSIKLTKPDKNGVIKLEFNRMDFLYYVILPKLYSLKWYSRKEIDFQLWKTTMEIYMKGLHNTTKGSNLLKLINNNINKKRYYSNYNISKNIIDDVLNMNTIYNYKLPYRMNSDIQRLNSMNNNNTKFINVGVFVYDLNNTLIMTFTGYRPAATYFNCSKHEIAKYIKNGNVFMNKYILKNILLD